MHPNRSSEPLKPPEARPETCRRPEKVVLCCLGALLKPKGPCTQIVYTVAFKSSLFRYCGDKVHKLGVHGTLLLPSKDSCFEAFGPKDPII